MEELAKEAKFMRECITKLEEAVINLSTNKVDWNAITTRSGLATKELLRKDMEVDDGVKEDIQEEGMIVEEIAREPIKIKIQLTREAKQGITCEKSYPHKPTKQDKE